MGLNITDFDHHIAPDSTNLFGDIKDNSGIGDGTSLNRTNLHDMFVFLRKLAADGGITLNGLPDNAVHGWQFNQALYNFIVSTVGALPEAWTTVSTYSGTYAADGTAPIKFRRAQVLPSGAYRVSVEGKVYNTSAATVSSASACFTLPSGYRPSKTLYRLFLDDVSPVNTSPRAIMLKIETTGLVTLIGDSTNTFNNVGAWISFQFDTDF